MNDVYIMTVIQFKVLINKEIKIPTGNFNALLLFYY